MISIDRFETEYRGWHLIHAALDQWAARKPGAAAILDATRGTQMTWAELRGGSLALAGELWRRGFRKGDFLAASLPLSSEHILLEYACFRIGVIHAPLDLRLQPDEVLRCLGLIRAKGYAFAPAGAAIAESARERWSFLDHLLPSAGLLEHASGSPGLPPSHVAAHDGAQVIFTTGSTGSPKPALLSHRGIACQNLCLGTAFGFGPDDRVLCNLPASHVGGQAELLLTTLFMGGAAVTLETFDAQKSLDAMERYGVTLIGQIPAMFQMEWRTSGWEQRNFTSLRAAVYGGQSVPRAFLDRMLQMAPAVATGLGLTETSGFCTYTGLTSDAEAVAGGVGRAMPAYPMSIRQPMGADGMAGPAVGAGEIGHICFRGPQTFLGYVNDPDATAAALSGDGWLYTGDMGSQSEAGLQFAGRAKWVLKPRGYQVFPGDVESHFTRLTERVASAGVVGHPHDLWSEGLIAFVEKRPGADLTEGELRRHARSLTSYMRPSHYVLLEPGTMPLNRTAKIDVVRLQELAAGEVRKLRAQGRWDRHRAVPSETDQPS